MIEAPQEEDVSLISEEEATRQDMIAALSQDRGGGLGIAGAHRTGKTTLCEHMAKGNPGIPFLKTSTREIAAKFDFDVDASHDFEHRMAFQEYVLLYHIGLWEGQTGTFWSDRTPLDFMAYMMADVPNGTIDPFMDRRIEAYINRCIEVTHKHFMTTIIVQPGIPYVQVPGAPALNLAYQEKISQLVVGFAKSHLTRPFYVLDRGVTKLESRARLIGQIVSKELGNLQSMLSWLPKN